MVQTDDCSTIQTEVHSTKIRSKAEKLRIWRKSNTKGSQLRGQKKPFDVLTVFTFRLEAAKLLLSEPVTRLSSDCRISYHLVALQGLLGYSRPHVASQVALSPSHPVT